MLFRSSKEVLHAQIKKRKNDRERKIYILWYLKNTGLTSPWIELLKPFQKMVVQSQSSAGKNKPVLVSEKDSCLDSI